MKVLFELLKEYTGLDKQEAEALFAIKENPKDWVLTAIDWIEPSTYRGMMELTEARNGKHTKAQGKAVKLAWFIPKPDSMVKQGIDSQAAYKDVGNAIPNEPSEKPYDLAKSVLGLGKLYPVLKDAHGNVIDGFHRLAVDPNWPSITLNYIQNTTDLEAARLATNFARRQIPKEEFDQRVGFLIGAGLKPQEIADKTGINISTIYKHMPQEMKDKVKVEAGRLGGLKSARPGEQTVKTQDITLETPSIESIQKQVMGEMRPCEQCGQDFHRSKGHLIKGLILCPKCAEKDRPKQKAQTDKPKETKPYTEAWKNRLATMQNAVSEMDRYVFEKLKGDQELRDKGYTVTLAKEYVLTLSDVTIEKPGLEHVIFHDHGETHKNRKARDEVIKDVLLWQEAIKKGGVHRIPYKGSFTPAKGDKVYAKIKEALS